jgi:magnesium transporter
MAKRQKPVERAARAISQTVGVASGLVGSLGRAVTTLGLPVGWGRHARDPGHRPSVPGASPGIESMAEAETPPPAGAVRIQCVDFAPDHFDITEVEDLVAFLAQPRPEGARVRWINFDGLHPWVVARVREHLGFHTLAAEDVLRVPQRPKVEDYPDHLFIVVRMLMLAPGEEVELRSEQISFFLYDGLLLSFQERPGDVWDIVRERMRRPESRLRQNDASYLLYSLLDALVDHCFPILERYGDRLEALEELVLRDARPAVQGAIHAMKRELSMLRRVIWPTREVITFLRREETREVSGFTKIYLRDVYDHTIQVMDVVETYREMAAGLNDLYMSAVGNRMNEIMKVLTIMASFFIPITFVAGVYGMNFEHIPELSWQHGYAAFWAVCGVMSGGLAVFFWRRGWIGPRD